MRDFFKSSPCCDLHTLMEIQLHAKGLSLWIQEKGRWQLASAVMKPSCWGIFQVALIHQPIFLFSSVSWLNIGFHFPGLNSSLPLFMQLFRGHSYNLKKSLWRENVKQDTASARSLDGIWRKSPMIKAQQPGRGTDCGRGTEITDTSEKWQFYRHWSPDSNEWARRLQTSMV